MGIVHAKSNEKLINSSNLPNQTVKNIQTTQENKRENQFVLDEIKARVDKIHIEGLCRTKNDIIEDCVRDLFKATNLEDVFIKAQQARLNLDELGCFKNIGIYIDTSTGTGSSPNGFEVTFNVKEHKRVVGGVTTQVGNNEGALLIGLRTPNLFGRGERFQVEYSHGSRKSTNFNASFIKPIRGKQRPV